jgi:hypothetical protein
MSSKTKMNAVLPVIVWVLNCTGQSRILSMLTSTVVRCAIACLLILFMFHTAHAQTTVPSASFLENSAISYFNGSFHLASATKSDVKARLTVEYTCPHTSVSRWVIVAAFPPTLPSQNNVQANILYNDRPSDQQSHERRLQRVIMLADIPVTATALKHMIKIGVTYQLHLFSRDLVPGPSRTRVEPLSAAERNIDLASDKSVNYRDPTVQQWLTDNALHQNRDETPIGFAYRVALTMKVKLRYEAYDSKDAVNTCKTSRSNCYGLSYLFAAILRANKIPARILIGHWARSGSGDECNDHAQVEFYAAQVGWVPVDISNAISDRENPAGGYFGHDDGDFITMHTNTDLEVDTRVSGLRTVSALFNAYIWFWQADTSASQDNTMHCQWDVDAIPVAR